MWEEGGLKSSQFKHSKAFFVATGIATDSAAYSAQQSSCIKYIIYTLAKDEAKM